jgi:hypothetical protein
MLQFVMIIHGKYSFEYMTSYKKAFIRSPFQYCFRDEFFSHVLFILDRKDGLPTFRTHHPINFENQPFFTSYKKLLKEKGKPYCYNAFSFDNPHFIIKAVGYQEVIANKKGTAVYYFFNDTFFMGEYIFKENSDQIRNICIGPYSDTGIIEDDNFYIENTSDRIIHYRDNGFTTDVKFLSLEDEKILEVLKRYHDRVTKRTLVMEP